MQPITSKSSSCSNFITQVKPHAVSVDHIMDKGERVKLFQPVIINIKPQTGKISTVMNRLGQLSTGPSIEISKSAQTCARKSGDYNDTCYCCGCKSENEGEKCSQRVLHCVRESHTWYDMYAPSITAINQSVEGTQHE